MQLPEFLYLKHMLYKQGLLPAPFRFNVNDAFAALEVQVVGYENDEVEYDALITHVAILAQNLNNAIPLHLSLSVTDTDFGAAKTTIWRVSNQDQAAAAYFLSGSPSLGILLRTGGKLYGKGTFAVSHATNDVTLSGIGYLIPRMVI